MAVAAGGSNGSVKLGDIPADVAADAMVPVFVRFKEQFFPDAEAYPAFIAANRHRQRSELRRDVVGHLTDISRRTWHDAKATINRLVKAGHLKNVKRFWLVNGISCDASLTGCRELADIEDVAHIYWQNLRDQNIHHRHTPPQVNPEEGARILRRFLDNWHDDSDDDFHVEDDWIPWNLRAIKADRVWSEEGVLGRGVVVGIIDNGTVDCPALTPALWRNKGQTLSGRDETGNGYVDDLFGYDFRRGSPCVFNATHPADRHGAIIAGIIAGRPHAQSGIVTGVAPRSHLMWLGYGEGRFDAFEYALENGADILSLSYSLEDIQGNLRGLYRLAHEHLDAAGILAVGGAGNKKGWVKRTDASSVYEHMPQGKQIVSPKDIPCVLTVGGIWRNRQRAFFSAHGPCTWDDVKFYRDHARRCPLRKPDVCAFVSGFPMWANSIEKLPWGPKKIWWVRRNLQAFSDELALVIGPIGNSFTGPQVAGTAALMFSANPELNPSEVKDIICRTAVHLGDDREAVGRGLVCALAAVRQAKKVRKQPHSTKDR
ncbi:MAG: S8 family serine peptidase [Planctomycetes bacterium]|nr:S8 family serine peptidase [Planctomycetota bacterium]